MTDTWPYLRRAGLVCATVFLVCSVRAAAATGAESPDRGMGWTREAIELYASLPIQDGGRVKPISTFAGFKLLKLNGRRKCRDLDGRTLKPTEWLMAMLSSG